MKGFEQATARHDAQDPRAADLQSSSLGLVNAAPAMRWDTTPDVERMRQVLFTISDIPGAREWMGTILHDAALELGAKR